MTCGCGDWYCLGNLFYIFERVAACCALAAVVSCIIFTVIISVGLGVGIGYNYCLVERKTAASEKSPASVESRRRAREGLSDSFKVTAYKIENTTKSDVDFETDSKFKSNNIKKLKSRKNTEKFKEILDDDNTQHAAIYSPSSTIMVVPLTSQMNISSIISRILAKNENVTVQFISI